MSPRWQKLVPEVRHRLTIPDFERWTWLPRPARVRIALYAEGSIRFDGGSFDGLQRVLAALNADPWFWVKFEVTLIHRGSDPSAGLENKDLNEIDFNDFDELWLFGISSGNLLSDAEIAAVHAFMDAGGGVLHTGDHASLGQGIAGAIKRAGKMRKYPAPPASPGLWNNTLRPGDNASYEFVDQSDDTPQAIRLRLYPSWSTFPKFLLRQYPHPVLCGRSGPIRIFPDHQHEGEAVAPDSYPATEWPSKDGYQPKVEVIAWGSIEAPDADVGREVGLVSVYDGHRADVGRIIADSTWHHWFDINLDGFAATPDGELHLAVIEQYFLNCAVWLAPPERQQQMRNALAWGAIWRDPLVMLDPKLYPSYVLGGFARDALGQFAPQCTIRQWIIDLIPIEILLNIDHLLPPPVPKPEPPLPWPIPLPMEELVLSSLIRPLMERNLKRAELPEEPDLDLVEEAVQRAVPQALEEMRQQFAALQQIGSALVEARKVPGQKGGPGKRR